MQLLLTREQAARIANECDQRAGVEVLITDATHYGGGNLTVGILNDDGDNICTFEMEPDGEVRCHA